MDHVPDVNTQANDFGVKNQELLSYQQRRLRNDEFTQQRLSLEPGAAMHVHVRQQVTQPQRRVDVFGIQGGNDDGTRWAGHHFIIGG